MARYNQVAAEQRHAPGFIAILIVFGDASHSSLQTDNTSGHWVDQVRSCHWNNPR
jgi:hypothetical protein